MTKLSIKRTLNATGISEYFINEMPFTSEEYRAEIDRYGLDLQHFLIYQGRLEDIGFKDGKQLSAIFEDLSGSVNMKEQYDAHQDRMKHLDDTIVNLTTEMQDLKMERVKLKGLMEYVDEYKQCVDQQKKLEAHIALGTIYAIDKEVEQTAEEIDEINKKVDGISSIKNIAIDKVKLAEAEVKKTKNRIDEKEVESRKLKDDII